jgi:hypothetical protein
MDVGAERVRHFYPDKIAAGRRAAQERKAVFLPTVDVGFQLRQFKQIFYR